MVFVKGVVFVRPRSTSRSGPTRGDLMSDAEFKKALAEPTPKKQPYEEDYAREFGGPTHPDLQPPAGQVEGGDGS
jgi:hypothetical protein